jgi:hypothetical protein
VKRLDIPFKVRGGSHSSWQNYALINEFIVSKNLSYGDGDDLIDLMNTVLQNSTDQPASTQKNVTINYKAIHEAVDKLNLRTLNEIEIALPEEYFGLKNVRGEPLRPFLGAHFNILERIAEVLLFCNPDHFQSQFLELKNLFNDRVFSNFESRECFSKLCVHTKQQYGASAIPICIGVGLDATQINSYFVYNLAGDSERSSFKCEFLGYAPTELPESTKELRNILSNNGCRAAANQNKAISGARHKAVQEFLYQVLKPILDAQNSGKCLTFQVGSSDKSFKIQAVPFVVAFIGDNEGSNHLLGIASPRNHYRCRICEVKNCTAFHVPEVGRRAENQVLTLASRSDDKYDRLSKDAAVGARKRAMGCFRNCTTVEKENYEECVALNVAPGENKLYAIASNTFRANICGLHAMTPPDHMHTHLKGSNETAMAYTMKVLYCVGDLDKSFAYSISSLDRLVSDFNINVSHPYVKKMVCFRTGISHFFPRKMLKTDRSTGLMTGGVPSWKYTSMIVQMQLCIGLETRLSLLPTGKQWCDKLIFKGHSIKFSRKWCVSEIVHNALSSTIEVMFALGKTEGTSADLVHMDYLIRLNTAHLLQLMDMAKELAHVLKSHTASSNSIAYASKPYKGIKLHMMLHFPFYRFFYGMFNFLTDTQLLEQSHVTTHLAFQRTSKTFISTVKEMANWQGKRMHALRLSERAKHSIQKEHLSKCPFVSNTTSFEFFESKRFGSLKGDVLTFDLNTKLYTSHSKGSFPGHSPRGLHPFLKLRDLTNCLTKYCEVNEIDKSTDMGIKMIKRTQRICEQSFTSLTLLYQINCSGNDEIPVPSFILYAEKEKSAHRGNRPTSIIREHLSTFSFFQVQYQNEHTQSPNEIITVRLMAILKFTTRPHFDKNQCTEHYMALVLKMKPVASDQTTTRHGPYDYLKYSLIGRNEYLDLDVINFSSFHMPACVLQPPVLENAVGETIYSKYKESIFYQIPSSRIVSTEAVFSYSCANGQVLSSEFLNHESLQEILDTVAHDEDHCDESNVSDNEDADQGCKTDDNESISDDSDDDIDL